jgi:hypothetical protein
MVEGLRTKGAHFRSLADLIDTSGPSGVLVLQMLGAVAEFERSLIRERTKAGLKTAKARGRVGGNPGLRRRDPVVLRKQADCGEGLAEPDLLSAAPRRVAWKGAAALMAGRNAMTLPWSGSSSPSSVKALLDRSRAAGLLVPMSARWSGPSRGSKKSAGYDGAHEQTHFDVPDRVRRTAGRLYPHLQRASTAPRSRPHKPAGAQPGRCRLVVSFHALADRTAGRAPGRARHAVPAAPRLLSLISASHLARCVHHASLTTEVLSYACRPPSRHRGFPEWGGAPGSRASSAAPSDPRLDEASHPEVVGWRCVS